MRTTQSPSLLIAQHDAVDALWYEKLHRISVEASEIYFALELGRAQLGRIHRQFFAHPTASNPDLRTIITNAPLLKARCHALTELRLTISQKESNPTVRNLYIARIAELEDQLNIVLAVHDHDSAGFTAANARIYHGPNPTIFAGVCAWIQRVANEQAAHPSTSVRRAVADLLSVMPRPVQAPAQLIPTLETFTLVRALHHAPYGYMQKLFSGSTVPRTITTNEVEGITRRILANIGCSYAVTETDNPNWGVSHANASVIYPHDYHATANELKGVLVHEIGSHLLERMNGLRQPLRLLASGLDRYDASNEGRAFLREQIIYGTPAAMLQQDSWQHIVTMHLAISLAMGLHDHPYSFQEVYRVINAVNILWQVLHGISLLAAKPLAEQQTWQIVTRVLKGTDGTSGAYLKDIVYLEGNVRCWQLANEQPAMLFAGDLGKFDITRIDHVTALQNLDILS